MTSLVITLKTDHLEHKINQILTLITRSTMLKVGSFTAMQWSVKRLLSISSAMFTDIEIGRRRNRLSPNNLQIKKKLKSPVFSKSTMLKTLKVIF